MISVDSVSKQYGALTAVDNLTFQVERGEIVGFVGPNGAGKSTMLKMLSTYLYPTSGHILVDGRDVVRESLEVRRRIGYLAGDTPLYRDMRVDKFLLFVGASRGLGKRELADSFERVVALCDIESVLLHRVHQCSTGFRQRIGLATALIHDPPVLLLDEPTHGFDPLQVIAFREMLRRLRPNRAILFSTHIVSDVEAISDRVLIIHLGRLLGNGRIDELADAAGVGASSSLETVFANLVRAAQDERERG
uniref:ABC-type multidrug transport system, ATPase component n=1 Tax=uncultured nuHF2 cluster bacterium HF0500_31B05 TaxID=723589 RepID=E7C5X1_9BACT|nr:ABC-type multidrug transport system, ATPase component [uncultured nuHF2 cluster bacterium HF0500_31B05]